MSGNDSFLELTPKEAAQLIEVTGRRSTGLCFALNSYENRVFEMELAGDGPGGEEGERVVAKFYRPGRWERPQIQDEHDFLLELAAEEFPVAEPLRSPNGETIFEVNGIFCCVFRKALGRSPEDFFANDFKKLGELIGIMHNIGARHVAPHRRRLTADEFGDKSLDILMEGKWIPPALEQSYVTACEDILDFLESRLKRLPALRLHGDCHRGNVLSAAVRDPNSRAPGFVFVDFDDMVMGPQVQDMWLLSPGRDEQAVEDRDLMIQGYEEIRRFDRGQLELVEALRGLRVIHYSAWIARRFHDPAFQRTFDQFKEQRYWEDELDQLREIAARLPR